VTTANALINKSLRMLGVLSSGEAPTAAEANDSLDSLNSIIDAYSANSMYYYSNLDEMFVLQGGQSYYCIGNDIVTISSLTYDIVTNLATATTNMPHSLETSNWVKISGAVQVEYNGVFKVTVSSSTVFVYGASPVITPATGLPVLTSADFYTVRPIRMLGAFLRGLDLVDEPLALITEQYWNNISDKLSLAGPGKIPTKLLYRPNYPFGQVILIPVPQGDVYLEIHLKTEKMIGAYSSLTFDQLLPPGFRRLLELSLAIDLAAEYGSRVPEQTVAVLKADLVSLIQTNLQSLQTSKIQTSGSNNPTALR